MRPFNCSRQLANFSLLTVLGLALLLPGFDAAGKTLIKPNGFPPPPSETELRRACAEQTEKLLNSTLDPAGEGADYTRQDVAFMRDVWADPDVSTDEFVRKISSRLGDSIKRGFLVALENELEYGIFFVGQVLEPHVKAPNPDARLKCEFRSYGKEWALLQLVLERRTDALSPTFGITVRSKQTMAGYKEITADIKNGRTDRYQKIENPTLDVGKMIEALDQYYQRVGVDLGLKKEWDNQQERRQQGRP